MVLKLLSLQKIVTYYKRPISLRPRQKNRFMLLPKVIFVVVLGLSYDMLRMKIILRTQ